MTVTDIIKAFGGRQVVSLLTGAQPANISMWRTNGVPAKYWPALVEKARERGVEGVTFPVLEATKPAKVAA